MGNVMCQDISDLKSSDLIIYGTVKNSQCRALLSIMDAAKITHVFKDDAQLFPA